MQGARDLKETLRRGHTQRFWRGVLLATAKAADSDVERTNALLQRFREGAPNRHHFANRLHLRSEGAVRAGEFGEIPTRNFNDDVIQRRLKAGGSHAGDVVG